MKLLLFSLLGFITGALNPGEPQSAELLFAGDAMQLAMTFYGPMFLLYSAYDAAEGDAEAKKEVFARLEAHIDRFIRQFSGQTTEHTQICVFLVYLPI